MVPPQRPEDSCSVGSEGHELVHQLCALLGLGAPDAVGRLSAGGSGSLVVALTFADDRMVLKVTNDPSRQVRARRELRLVSECQSDLRGCLPRFIAGDDDGDRVCLVTQEYASLPHATMIDSSQWRAVATSLGGLHEAMVPPWLPPPDATPPASPKMLFDACRAWGRYGVGGAARRAAEVIRTADDATGSVSGAGIVHGDCHVDNIVRDEHGSLRWIDWQEVRRGKGLADLAFLWQRAEFAGANPPREAMARAYRVARGLRDSDRWRRELQLAELRILLISWPPFLSYGSPAARARMVERLTVLGGAISTHSW